MLLNIAYVLIWLVVAQRVFTMIMRYVNEEFGIEMPEIVFGSFISIILGGVWFITVPFYCIYRFVLKPIVDTIEKESEQDEV